MDSLSTVWILLERLTQRDDIEVHRVEGDAHPVLRQMDYSGVDYVARIGAYHYGIGYREQDWAFRKYRTFTLRHHARRVRKSEYEKTEHQGRTDVMPILGPSLKIHAFTDGLNTTAAMASSIAIASVLDQGYSMPDFYAIPWDVVPGVLLTGEFQRNTAVV